MTAKIKRRGFMAALTTGVAAASGSRVLAKNKSGSARELTLNPYEGTDQPGVEQLRGNLHTHTRGHKIQEDGSILYANGEIIGPNGDVVRPPVAGHEDGHERRNPHPDFVDAEGTQAGSDGSIRPDELIDAYAREGYGFLSLTDHDRVTWPWQAYGRDPKDTGMVAIVGNELTRNIHHTLSLFTDYAPPWGDGRTLEGVIDGVGKAGGLAVIAHPTRDWPLNFVKSQAQALEVPLDPGLREISTGDFTVEAWFLTTNTGRNVLLGNYAPNTAFLNLELHTRNRVRVIFSSGGGGARGVDLNVPADSIGINTRDGQWHHLAAVRQGTTMTLYLDGKQVAQSDTVAAREPLGGDVMFIGRDTRKDSTMFDGLLDHVSFWDRALSPSEVAGLQNGVLARRGLLRQYAFNPASADEAKRGRVTKEMLADTAQHSRGPVAAVLSAAGSPQADESVPPALQQAGLSTASLRFGSGSADPADGAPGYVLDIYMDLYNRYPHLIGMEVLNGTRPRDFAGDRRLWDDLLMLMMPRRPIWGMATDDLHGWGHFVRDWVSVLTPKRDVASIRKAMEEGAFFFSSIRPLGDAASAEQTPALRSVRHDRANGTLSAEATLGGRALLDRDAFAWIADGQVVQTGPQLHYRTASGIRNYARLEVTGPGGISFTNPFGFGV